MLLPRPRGRSFLSKRLRGAKRGLPADAAGEAEGHKGARAREAPGCLLGPPPRRGRCEVCSSPAGTCSACVCCFALRPSPSCSRSVCKPPKPSYRKQRACGVPPEGQFGRANENGVWSSQQSAWNSTETFAQGSCPGTDSSIPPLFRRRAFALPGRARLVGHWTAGSKSR